MISVLTTAVILLLYCSLLETNAYGPVTSNDTSGDVSGKARERSIRQIPMCQDEFETLKSRAFTSNTREIRYAKGNFTVARQCIDWCMQYVHCGSVEHFSNRFSSLGSTCKYIDYVTKDVQTPKFEHLYTYFRVIVRCPKHYRCSDTPCQNGATCINATTSGRGVTCTCADGWTSWFCEKRQTCQNHKCQNGATCRYIEKVGINCSCPAGYEGSYCQWPLNTTATTIFTTEDNSDGMSATEKTLVVAGVTAGIVVTGVAAAAVIGAAASTTTAAATTGGATVVARGGANVAEIGGKAGASTMTSFGWKWYKGAGKRRDSDDEDENEASTSEISVIDFVYAQVKGLMIAEDHKSTSGK